MTESSMTHCDRCGRDIDEADLIKIDKMTSVCEDCRAGMDLRDGPEPEEAERDV